jgi:hypothetical protein
VDGLFAQLYRQASDGELPDAVAFHGTSASMNPTLDPATLSLEESRDPDAYAAEFLAQFTGSGGAFLSMDRFTVPDRDYALSPDDVVPPVVVGLDPAFAGRDEFGVSVLGRDPEEPQRLVLASVDGLRPRRADAIEDRAAVELELLGQVVEVCKRFGATAVTDQYASRQVVEFLRREGVSVYVLSMTATTKTAAYVETRSRLYSGGLLIYREPGLLDELRRLRSRVAAGQSSVVVPRAGSTHGDRAQSLAIAVLAQSQLGGGGGGGDVVAGGRGISAGIDQALGVAPPRRDVDVTTTREPPPGWYGGTSVRDMQW